MSVYPGDPGDPATAVSDHRVHQVIRALRDLDVTDPAGAGSTLTVAGTRLTPGQRERILQAFAAEGGWTFAGCT